MGYLLLTDTVISNIHCGFRPLSVFETEQI